MLKQLLEKLRAKSAELEALENKDAMTADDLKTLEAVSTEVEDLNTQIEKLQRAKAARARSAELVPAGAGLDTDDVDETRPGIGHNSGIKTVAWPIEKLAPGDRVAMGIAASFKAISTKQPLQKVLEDDGGTRLLKEVLGVEKVLNTGTNSAGGFAVPTALANDLIELLYPATVFLQSGPRRIPMPNGRIELPGALAGATAGWVGEGGAKPYTEATFRKIDLKAKKLAAITGLTWEMTQYSVFDIVGFARADLQQAIAQGLDTGLLMGAGTGNIPLGILKIGTVGTRVSANATAPTIAQIDADLSKMTMAMESANMLNRGGWRWLMAPRTREYISSLRDGIAGYAYPTMQGGNGGTLKGIPVSTTTAIPTNLGAGTNESTIALVDFNEVIWGSSLDLTTRASDIAAVDMGAGLVSAFQNNLVFLLAEMTADVEIRRDAAVQLLTAVKWGA